jgi:hypothetical protein
MCATVLGESKHAHRSSNGGSGRVLHINNKTHLAAAAAAPPSILVGWLMNRWLQLLLVL